MSLASNDHIMERSISQFNKLERLNNQFLINKQTFDQQYASIYYLRLTKLRKAILNAAKERWSGLSEVPRYVAKVLDTQPHELCYMIGTVYIHMVKKPNILNDLEDEEAIIRPMVPTKYKSEEDVFSIEDETGRVEIIGACLNKEFLVTGMIIGILGKEAATGTFEVIDVCLPGIPDQSPLNSLQVSEKPKYVALLSGLSIGSDTCSEIQTQLLQEFLVGELESDLSPFITRVILAGNSISKPKQTKGADRFKRYVHDSSTFDASAVTQLDEFLEEVCSAVDLDIMPGQTDPAQVHLPQQRMHPAMFRQSHKLSTFHSVSNPYWCEIDNVKLLGTSGQNVDDIYRYVDSEDRMKMAESCLYWRHMAPSCPDTLWSYPFQDIDPFIIEECPHVYFIGNQPEYEDNLLLGPNGQKIRVVLIPSFSETGIVVLVNLSTLECHTVNISNHGKAKSSDPMDQSL